MEAIREFLITELGLSLEAQHKIALSILIVFFLSLFRITLLRIVWKRTRDIKIRYEWKRSLSLLIPLVGVILVAAVWLPAFKQFGAFLGLFSAGLAIALKDPLTNFAGWIFILFRKPFVVGDRVQIGENAGDVVDIRIFQFTLLEIGNWVEADQSTGRIIHVPNGQVFNVAQANYTSGFEYIWNEIQVLITFESNWEKAKSILKDIIDRYTSEIISAAEKEIFEASKNYLIYYKHITPIVYTKVKSSGVQLTIRYLCNPRKRRGTENEIWEEILRNFKMHRDIEFAYPTTRFYRPGEEMNQQLK
ncbi:MAG: mechanosensitive ion channel family protein [Bacteroidetes bacterium]|nr:MAG: mechanosensitive ion channel family protein [Bacteroidota bacterium]